jgi:DNA-binding protein YbaB
MRIDPDQITCEIEDAYGEVRPHGPFHGSAPGVDVTVDADGGITDLRFTEAVYRATHSDDLGRAVVAAYRDARTAAMTTREQAIGTMLRGWGIEPAWRTP